MLKYFWPTFGPASIAGSQFLLTFQLLHTLDAARFGSFFFLMIAAQFMVGIWAALFCAPLPAVHSKSDGATLATSISALFTTNLLAAVATGAIFSAIAIGLSFTPWQAALFGVFASVNLLRSLGRANAYVQGLPFRTTLSDVTYGVILLATVGVLFVWPEHSLTIVCAAMAIGAIVGLCAFGTGYLRELAAARFSHLTHYRALWRDYARWSVVGVITTEATANAHAYIVTLAFGPAGFAPVAASSLFFRPFNVVMNALSDFERPRIGRQIAGRNYQGVQTSLRHFRLALALAWLGTGILTAAVLIFAPSAVLPESYAIGDIAFGAAVWLVISGLRTVRVPDSIAMQAGGEFRQLAGSSVYSCGCSIAAVVILVFVGGPVWSMVGIAAGELIFALSVRARARAFLASLPKK